MHLLQCATHSSQTTMDYRLHFFAQISGAEIHLETLRNLDLSIAALSELLVLTYASLVSTTSEHLVLDVALRS